MRRLKHALAALLRLPLVNLAARAALRPFAGLLPIERLARVPVVGDVRVALPGGRTLVLASDGRDLIASALAFRGLAGWEPETLPVFQRLLPGARTFLDVGASTGLFSLLAALDDPARRVWAFEPSPRTAQALRHNLARNGAGNVTVLELALAADDGAAKLWIPPGESLPLGASTLPAFRAGGEAVPVRARRLDALAAELAWPAIDLVKLDTEGTEPAVLEGARDLLARDEPWIVCEVLHGLTEERLHAVLDPIGYRYFALTARGPVEHSRIAGDPSYRDRNWLFATPGRIARADQSIRTSLVTARSPAPRSTAK